MKETRITHHNVYLHEIIIINNNNNGKKKTYFINSPQIEN